MPKTPRQTFLRDARSSDTQINLRDYIDTSIDGEIQRLLVITQEITERLDQADRLLSEAAIQRFGAAEKAVNLVSDKMDAKFIAVAESARLVANTVDVRFKALDDTIRLIYDSYARLQLVEKAAELVSHNVNHRFGAVEQSVSYIESTYARAELVDKSTQLFKESVATQFQAAEHAAALTLATTNLRFDEIEKATTLAREALSVRLESMNQIREQLDKQAAAFIVRAELDALRNELMGRFATSDTARASVADRIAAVERSGITRIDGEAIGKRITELEAYKNTQEGRAVAQSAVIGAIVTLVNVAIGIALHFIH